LRRWRNRGKEIQNPNNTNTTRQASDRKIRETEERRREEVGKDVEKKL